jgi:hypothetical protein
MENYMRKHATLKEKIAIHDKLREVLVKDGDYWNYVHPWTDEAVAKAIGGYATWAAVRGARRELFGNMRRAATVDGSLANRVLRIEEYLTRQNPHWNK